MQMSLREQLSTIFSNLTATMIDAIPELLAAIVLILLAFIVAAVVERVLRALLVRLRFDTLVRRTGVDHWLHRVGIRQSIDQFIPRVAYFLLLFLFVRTAADVMGLEAISAAIGTVLAYLPNLVAALLILVFGAAASKFIGTAVTNAAMAANVESARLLGRVVGGVTLFVLSVMALGQLRVDTEMIRLFSTAILAGVVLAFGLSFGLGTREATRNIIAGFYARKTLRMGQELEVRGEKGVLTAIHPTQTILRRDDRTIIVANSVFLDEIARQ